MKLHSYLYIEKTARSEIMDRTAYMDEESSVYFPYRNLSVFYGEYKDRCFNMGDPVCASLSTFRRAYDDVVKKLKTEGIKIKFSGGKGMYRIQCNLKVFYDYI